MPSKITIDSDSILLRRLFALNPATQGLISSSHVPLVGSNALVTFYTTNQFFSTISSASATGSVLNLLTDAQQGISSISTQTGELNASLVSTFLTQTLSTFSSIIEVSVNDILVSTVQGLGSAGYISSVQSDPQAISLYSFTLTDGVNSTVLTVSSPFLQFDYDYLPSSNSLISTVGGLGTSGYLSTNFFFSSAVFSTVTKILVNSNEYYTDIAYGDGKWVAVGSNGLITGGYTSSNLVDWVETDTNLANTIAYDSVSTFWIGGTTLNTPKYSSTANSWLAYTSGMLDFTGINKIIHTPQGWYVGGTWNTGLSGSNNSSIMHSFTGFDDLNWFAMEGGVGINTVRDITYNSTFGRYMAIGDNGGNSNIIISSDGSNWSYTPTNPNVGNTYLSVTNNQSNTWIISGFDTSFIDKLFITNDFGSSWTTIPFFYGTRLDNAKGNMYALTDYGLANTSTLMRSTDGTNWTPIPSFLSPILQTPQTIRYENNQYVIVGPTPSFSNSSIQVSIGSDSNWKIPDVTSSFNSTVYTVPPGNFSFSSVKGYTLIVENYQSTFLPIEIPAISIEDIHYGNGLWVAVTPIGQGGVFSSSNLITWTLNDVNVGNTVDYRSNLWLGGGPSYPYSSADGITWTPFVSGFLTFGPINKILQTQARWYVCGVWSGAGSNNSSIMYSATGVDDRNWSAIDGGVGINIVYDIAYNSTFGRYMAVGDNGTNSNIIISSDGITWSYPPTNPGINILTSVATNQSTLWLVAGNDSNTGIASLALTSNFGTTWITISPFLDAGAPNLRYANNSFYALGQGDLTNTSTVLKSSTGSNWIPISTFDTYYQNNILRPNTIAFSTGTYVIGGIQPLSFQNSSIIVSLNSDTNWSYNIPVTASTVSTVLTTRYSEVNSININDTFTGIPSTIITQSSLGSTLIGLGTLGYESTLSTVDFVKSLGSYGYRSTFISTFTSLSVVSTISFDSGNLSTVIVPSQTGFLTANDMELHYESTLMSTINNLEILNFINFTSTTNGLASSDYVSSSQLQSSFASLIPYGYYSNANLLSTVTGIDGYTGFNSYVTGYLRIPPPFVSTNAFHIFQSSLTIGGNQYKSTPIDQNSPGLFSTIEINLLGFSNLLLSNSRLGIEIPINTNFKYFDSVEQTVSHSFFLQDAFGLLRGKRTNSISYVSSVTNSNVFFGSLKYLLEYRDLNLPFFNSTLTLMISTSAANPFSTIMDMFVPSTSVIVQLNNLNR